MPSKYDKLMKEGLCLKRASAGFSIVSRLVRWIDIFSHKAVLSVGADTIDVFGCGLGKTLSAGEC
jgi:predicted Rossmann fold nucleotide-binding protein DprA/Smf involved in DNA uptake